MKVGRCRADLAIGSLWIWCGAAEERCPTLPPPSSLAQFAIADKHVQHHSPDHRCQEAPPVGTLPVCATWFG
eukprot:3677588-Alexandrium_andersonii.AAC.1